MVAVFKTDVQQTRMASMLIAELMLLFPGSRINFDLEDCDRVLRVEGQQLCSKKIAQLLELRGHLCQELT